MADAPQRVKVTQEGTPIPAGFEPGAYVTFIKRKDNDTEGRGKIESVGNRELLVTEDGTKQMYVILWEDAQPAAPKAPAKGKKEDKNAAAQTSLTP